MTRNDIITTFEKAGAIQHGHFLLSSGRHSDTYMQCALLFANPLQSELLCRILTQKMDSFNITCVASPALGGIVMGYEIARCLRVKNYFAERVEGKMTFRRGFASLVKGERVLVVEDVVTTGGSVNDVIELVRSEGGNVVCVASIIDRSDGSLDFGVPWYSIMSLDIKSYPADECPLCKANTIPLYKPGSRA